MAGRLISILFLLALALVGIFSRDIVLGLDLKGGVTMRYELEPPDTVPESTDLDTMIDATVDTLRTRINAYGIKESAITRQGTNEIVIELPGSSKDEAETIKSVISRVGHLEFRIVLRADGSDDDARNNVVVADEVKRLEELLALEENQGKGPEDIDLSALETRVPGELVYRWIPLSDKLIAERRGGSLDDATIEGVLADAPLRASDFVFVRFELTGSKTFTGADIEWARQSTDNRGNPAVGISMRPDRTAEFGDWTEPNKGRAMGMLLDGRLPQESAVIQDRLEGNFVIRSGSPAGFTTKEIKDYLTVIKSGSLQMKPRLLFENTVGPSLGEASIKAGMWASGLGFVAIILFMILYYRVSGVIASLCLLVNMTLLAGTLMVLGATLTLPGIAGLVLTLGMAVDANILVFERMREEADRAKSVDQAVKLGFEKAFSTIVDANVTTFVTAAILYKVGTGPVRGFAVILMFGILTSVFSVLVVGRVIYDALVARGFKSIGMGRLLKRETAIPFMSKGKLALRISAGVVVLSLIAFFTADRDKYGLDFLGGYKAQVRLNEPRSQGEVAATIGARFPGAQVISVADPGSEVQGRSRQFVIKVKASPDEAAAAAGDDQEALEARYETPLKASLAGIVLPDFVSDLSLSEDPDSATTSIAAVLHFESPRDAQQPATPERVAPHLGFLAGLETSAADDGGIAVRGTCARVGLDRQQVVQRLRTSLTAAPDLPAPSEPFIESTTIGSRVGTELRDSAIRAILLSFIAIVLYIRVRFREYRYGIASIVALAHDVSITLGIVALMHFSGLVDVEIDLALIAAFLTIIGYSLNDTIVLFDRIRENLPRLTGKPYEEVLDISINQTLARTLLTSMTTLTALILIFALNYGKQNVLEGFSFAMILGVLVGTYSSIFVASPVLAMMGAGKHSHVAAAPAAPPRKGERKQQGATT